MWESHPESQALRTESLPGPEVEQHLSPERGREGRGGSLGAGCAEPSLTSEQQVQSSEEETSRSVPERLGGKAPGRGRGQAAQRRVVATLVSSGCPRSVPQTTWVNDRNFLSHSARSYEPNQSVAGLVPAEGSEGRLSPVGGCWQSSCFLACVQKLHPKAPPPPLHVHTVCFWVSFCPNSPPPFFFL